MVTLENIVSGPFSHGDIPQPVPEWWFDPEKVGGGALLDIGYHLIDLYRFFAGDCHLLSSHLKHKFNLPVEDAAIAVLQSDKLPTTGIVHVGWYQQMISSGTDMRVILHGDYAYISSEQFAPSNIYTYAFKEGIKNVFRKIGGRRIRPLTFSHYDAYDQELAHFFYCLENDLEPSVSAIDGLRTVEVIEEAYRRDKRSPKGE
jgi:predicted dehydrogenase